MRHGIISSIKHLIVFLLKLGKLVAPVMDAIGGMIAISLGCSRVITRGLTMSLLTKRSYTYRVFSFQAQLIDFNSRSLCE